jgi:uncharacterized membrane protein
MAGLRQRLSDVGVVIGLAVQIGLILVGVSYLFAADNDESVGLLLLWCLLGTAYAVSMIAALWVSSITGGGVADWRPTTVQVNPAVRLVALGASVAAGLTGVLSAVLVLLLRADPELGWLVKGLGAWAMLLAWGLVHWGFAQWYFQVYYASEQAPLAFPGTPSPLLVDFTYFAFTLGTTFTTSDVSILTRRVRWMATIHGVTSFFFNSAIIVLALNTLLGQD